MNENLDANQQAYKSKRDNSKSVLFFILLIFLD